MKLSSTLLVTAAAAFSLSGCAAVVAFPAGAGAVLAKKQANKKRRQQAEQAKADAAKPGVTLTTLTALPPPSGGDAAPAMSLPGKVPPGMQFLYGSGEAAALSYQAYLGVIDLIIAKSSDRAVGQTVFSVVLAPGSTLDAPKFIPCGAKPLAVVFDIDETALLNLGYEADESQRGGPYDQSRWDRWERSGAQAVVATPGMIEVARVAKASNVTLVFNSNRMAANAADTEAALNGAGLGPAVHGKNLWLQGDAGTGGAKDARRQAIAAKFCVVAMAGDQLGDFSDLFNAPGLGPVARRALASSRSVKIMWGHGWFVLPNPVYGTGLKGDLDQVFPNDKRWVDPGPAVPPPTPPPPEAKP
ncbi:MAG: HAD family acid phosphatase [Pseudomonadota bacterium]